MVDDRVRGVHGALLDEVHDVAHAAAAAALDADAQAQRVTLGLSLQLLQLLERLRRQRDGGRQRRSGLCASSARGGVSSGGVVARRAIQLGPR